MTPDEISRIKKIPLFCELDDAVIVAVAEVGTRRDFAAGDVVFRKGDVGDELYVVLSGAVRINSVDDETDLEIAVLREGSYFGEMSVIDGSARSANATVVTPGQMLVVQRADYLKLLVRFEPLLRDLLMRLSRNIRDSNTHRFGLVHEKTTLKEEAELDRLRSLSQMVAGVAHELNTPLGIIQNAASLITDMVPASAIPALAQDADAAEVLRDLAEACVLIQKSATVAARLVQSFKSLSVRQVVDVREEVDIVAVIMEALDLYKLKARSSNLKLVAHSALLTSERTWNGFPGHLTQVILNMVTNADRYAYPEERGGTIEVSIDAAEIRKQPGFEIVVRDFGCGIKASDLPKIWTPFFTTGRSKGGTGLGLAIVHNIVTSALGGTVRAESTEGRGTTFILRLPSMAPEGAH